MARKDFHHPYQPYDIQQDFMEALYECIEQGQVGIFESPTGTGKSLSLICGSLTWLREHKRRKYDEAIARVEIDDDEPDWMREHAREERSREIRQMRQEFEARLTRIRHREKRMREQLARAEPLRKKRKALDGEAKRTPSVDDEEQYILDDYESGDDHGKDSKTEYSSETSKLMEKLGMLPVSSNKDDKGEVVEEMKILFCSRTHSQLSQFTGELGRVKLPPGLPPDQSEEGDIAEELKHLTLGSRKNLCINAKVSSLPTLTAVNERCVELQQSKSPAEQKCNFLPKKENEDVVLDFRDHALAKIRDIEDLAKLGERLQICPYYASRPAINSAEIVTLPYPLLLQKTAREALGICLKDHVVIIDEAHNLLSAVEGIYSTSITDAQLVYVKEALITYLQKFRNRLKGSNRVYLAQLVRVIDSLIQFTRSVHERSTSNVTNPGALLHGKGVDQINLSKLVRYISESKLARKVESYAASLANTRDKTRPGAETAPVKAEVPVLMHVQNFLMALMNPSKEGRFLWSFEGGKTLIKYMLLNPAEHFRDIVEESRAVILAGGTMSPMDEYKQQLFPYLPSLFTFSCGHLIPPESLLVRSVTTDNAGRLDFTFKSRDAKSAQRIGNALSGLADHVVGGLVVFLPSYGYLEEVQRAWKDDPSLAALHSKRRIFSDSRTGSAEHIFREYSDTIREKGSAMLLSVVGGKLSEGINFSDELGRCVVVVGLPYPNLHTPDWRAKMQYLEEQATQRGEPRGQASKEHAENVCMRSVNQAIGRAIRHKNDWASIILFDARYSDKRIQTKLPGWIKAGMKDGASESLDDVVQDLSQFFRNKGGGAA